MAEHSEAESALQHVRVARTLVCGTMPHLSGLAYRVQITVTTHVRTAAVAASGRLAINPQWYLALSHADAAFVFAHELLHLAHGHHARFAEAKNKRLANIAMDAVINESLREVFRLSRVPAQGVWFDWAVGRSSEEVLRWLEDAPGVWMGLAGSFSGENSQTSPLADALRRAGLTVNEAELDGDWDLMDEPSERRILGGFSPSQREAMVAETEQLSREALAIEVALSRFGGGAVGAAEGRAGARSDTVEALATSYQPAWELALQRWLEDVRPGTRTYGRASRREAGDGSVVLPGRTREGWTLNIVLDTSGSMASALPHFLGLIQSFAVTVNVASVRILQCNGRVTVDERIDVTALSEYSAVQGVTRHPVSEIYADQGVTRPPQISSLAPVRARAGKRRRRATATRNAGPAHGAQPALLGYGARLTHASQPAVQEYAGSDISPALLRLAEDQYVHAAIVLSRGFIAIPANPPPFDVLWVIVGGAQRAFPYGHVLQLPSVATPKREAPHGRHH